MDLALREFSMSPTRLVFGVGSIGRLADAVGGDDHRRVLVVTDPGVRAAGICDRVVRVLEGAGIEVAVYDGVRPSPTISDVEGGSAAAASLDDGFVIVAIGGGSAMDAAKAIALHVTNPGPVVALDYRHQMAHPAIPIVAVPTTAGTGAETNGFGVITDDARHVKVYCGDPSAQPRIAILDPELTLSLPAAATAATGMDALTHALESMASLASNPVADALNVATVRMVGENLARAVADGSDIEARANMLLAAHMAGVSLSATGLGACHAIGHSLSTRLGVPHGLGLAILLPHVLAFNVEVRSAAFAEAALAIGAGASGASDEANAAALIDAVSTLSGRVGTRRSIDTVGVTDELVETLADDSFHDVVLANNPRPATREDLAGIIVAAR